MTDLNLIETVVDKLQKYPDIKFDKLSDCELEIYKAESNGFDILLQTDRRENTLLFGSFHWHFDNTDIETNELLNQIIFGLTGIARVKEYSKNGTPYKWKLELQDKDGTWYNHGIVFAFNFNFWTKTETKYYQNNMLPKELIFKNDDTVDNYFKQT